MPRNDMKRQAALEALMGSSSLTEAAERAGISRRTLYNYTHEDLEFARAYKQIQDEATITHLENLERNRERASSVLLELMEDKGQPGSVRLKAAQSFIEAARVQKEDVLKIAKTNVTRNKDPFDTSIG